MEDLIAHFAAEMPDAELRCDGLPGPDYNVAPTREIAVVVPDEDGGGIRTELLHWGLIPSWAKDASGASRLINARVESVHERPSYRGLVGGARHHRCVVPMSGFYEWRSDSGRKQPIYVRPRTSRVFCVAGLWTRSKSLEIASVTILTRDAYPEVAPHHDRSPVVLAGPDLAEWFGHSDDPLAVARRAPAPAVTVTEVSTAVNSVRNNGPDLIRPTDRLV